MNSLLIRGETRKLHGYRTKRQQNGKFVLRVEVVGLLAWLGILGAVINEGIHLHFGGRFDKIAKAMLSMIVLQCGCFVLSAWWGYRTSLQRRNVRKRWGQYAEIEA
jgi:hypothetical protein